MKSALLALLFFLPTIVFAQSDPSALRNSGNDYVHICGAAAQGQASPNATACGIWLTGVMHGLEAYNTNMKVPALVDAPNVAAGQVAKLLVNYVTSHPQSGIAADVSAGSGCAARSLPTQASLGDAEEVTSNAMPPQSRRIL